MNPARNQSLCHQRQESEISACSAFPVADDPLALPSPASTSSSQ